MLALGKLKSEEREVNTVRLEPAWLRSSQEGGCEVQRRRKRRKRKKEGEKRSVGKIDGGFLLRFSASPWKVTGQSPPLRLLLSQLTPRAASAYPKVATTSEFPQFESKPTIC